MPRLGGKGKWYYLKRGATQRGERMWVGSMFKIFFLEIKERGCKL